MEVIDPTQTPVRELKWRMRQILATPSLIPNDPLPEDHFRCSLCFRVSQKAWTQEEAEAEMRDRFGNLPPEERVEICDDCNEIMKRDMGY